MMEQYRRQVIQARARDVLTDAGIDTLPISPRDIARHFEIDIHAKPAERSGASGWLVRSGDQFAIVYATHIDSAAFQNFSIAHELGHYCLDGHPEHIFRAGNEHSSRAGFNSGDVIEQEADYFAACLLMPKHLCTQLINQSADGMPAVIALAGQCSTSLVASALRYAEIGHLPTAVLQCRNARVEFCASHPLSKHVGWARPLLRNSRVPVESATWRLAQDHEAVARAGEDSDCAAACDWFAGAHSNATLVEEVIGLGRFGRTLTLLTLETTDAEESTDRAPWEAGRLE